MQNGIWCYTVHDEDGNSSGQVDIEPDIDNDDDIDRAIDKVCQLFGDGLTPDQFARRYSGTIGYAAVWAQAGQPIRPARYEHR